jgi:hypothetical protein
MGAVRPVSDMRAARARFLSKSVDDSEPFCGASVAAWGSTGVGAQMSKKTLSVHCPVCNVSSPRDLSELARPSGQSCLICGAFFSDYAWGELATALLAVQQLSDHFRAGVSHAR